MRKFLVVLDDSRECLNAMRFAAQTDHNIAQRPVIHIHDAFPGDAPRINI